MMVRRRYPCLIRNNYFQISIFVIIVITGKSVLTHSDAFPIPAPTSIKSLRGVQARPGRHVVPSSASAIYQRNNGDQSGTSSDNKDSKDTALRQLSKPNLVRGSNYGENNNSTIPQPSEVAAKLGVKPTKEASAKEWQRAWKLLKRALPILHYFDRIKPVDSSLNLACMWWKALSGNDRSSPVFDDGLSYDILPSVTRWIVSKRLCRFFPRLHHGNVELRTAYLDGAIRGIVDREMNSNRGQKIRLVCFGAGYDLRSVKLLEKSNIDVAHELDLDQVVETKQKLFGRLLKRRPWLKGIPMPSLTPINLNNIVQVREELVQILSKGNTNDYHTIFVFEGVMIYLDEGIPSNLLKTISSVLKECGAENASLCFADRLENIPGGDFDAGTEELSSNGWDITDWCPKPGLARHMGSARFMNDN